MQRTIFPFMVALLLVLTSCTVDDKQLSEPTFKAAGGTLNLSNGLGASFLFLFNLQRTPTEPITVKITGPSSWNNGQPITRSYVRTPVSVKAYWLNISSDETGDYLPVVSGRYTIQATIDGKEYTETVQIDSTKLLDRISTFQEEILTESEVAFSWGAVQGARSYYVEFYSVDDNSIPRGEKWLYTASPNALFEGLDLEQQATYGIGIMAFTAKLATDTPTLPDGPFNTSFISATITLP